MKKILGLIILFIPILAMSVEYMPYETADVSHEQWESYRQNVIAKYGASAQYFPEQSLVVYFNDEEATNYAFTTDGHAAHPAWITRQVVENNGQISIQQIGYFAGKEEPFAALFQQYLELNERIKASMQSGG
jgi:hypothetical protein